MILFSLVEVVESPVEASKFVKCMAKCLGKSVADIENWYRECKKNFKCWAKTVGKAALKCGPKCLRPFSVDEPQLDELENSAVTAGRLNLNVRSISCGNQFGR